MTFDVHVEDQDHSAHLLREGRVMAAVTADPQPVQGCQVLPLGTLRYRALASPAFMRRHFATGVTAATLALWVLGAPAPLVELARLYGVDGLLSLS